VTDQNEKLREHDAAIDELRRRLERVEGLVGVKDVDAAGIPSSGERAASSPPTPPVQH
jgi:hypothetical protein